MLNVFLQVHYLYFKDYNLFLLPPLTYSKLCHEFWISKIFFTMLHSGLIEGLAIFLKMLSFLSFGIYIWSKKEEAFFIYNIWKIAFENLFFFLPDIIWILHTVTQNFTILLFFKIFEWIYFIFWVKHTFLTYF